MLKHLASPKDSTSPISGHFEGLRAWRDSPLQQIAISTLSEILVDPEARASDRIQAARTLMSGSDAFAERKLLERKLSDLEHQLTKGIQKEKQKPLAPLPEIEEAALVYAGSSEDDE